MTAGGSVRLVLASRSPRRKTLLEEAGYDVECDAPDVDELAPFGQSARELVLINAERKALAVSARRVGDVVLGADTVVSLDEEIFGKPADLNHAREMIRRMAGRVHEVVTGVCVAHWERHVMVKFVEATRVKFRALGEGEIGDYLVSIDPLDKAGAYAAQEDSGRIIERIEGSFSNVVGLPLERVAETLEVHFGFAGR